MGADNGSQTDLFDELDIVFLILNEKPILSWKGMTLNLSKHPR
jgi:hypothetical protein